MPMQGDSFGDALPFKHGLTTLRPYCIAYTEVWAHTTSGHISRSMGPLRVSQYRRGWVYTIRAITEGTTTIVWGLLYTIMPIQTIHDCSPRVLAPFMKIRETTELRESEELNRSPSWGFKWHHRIGTTQKIRTISIITIKSHTQTPPLVEGTMTTLSHLTDNRSAL